MASMQSADVHHDELDLVRYQLRNLASRRLAGLAETDEALYRDLCLLEEQLLGLT
jgi:hypothetical protein